MITFEEIKKELDIAQSLHDLSEDISFYNENIAALCSNDIQKIRDRLNKSIEKYGEAINELSIFTNVKIVKTEYSYNRALNSLIYLTDNIPLYVAYIYLKDKFIKIVLKIIEKGI